MIPSASAADAATYIVIVSNTAGSVESATAVVTVNVIDPYFNWALDHFGENAATNGAPNVDFDNDGLVNKLEFFLWSNPKSGASGDMQPTADRSTIGTPALVFSFKRAKVAQNLPWSVEFASALGNTWNIAVHGQNGAAIQTTSIDADFDDVTVTIPTTADRIFARLRLE